jgi:ABC-type sugar transport system permease subunit
MLLNFVNQIIGIFQTLDAPLTMTGGGPNGASSTLGFQLYQYAFNSGGRATGQAMALGLIIFVILLVATCFYFWMNKKIEESY